MFCSYTWFALLATACLVNTAGVPFAGDKQNDNVFCSSCIDCFISGEKYWNTLQRTLGQKDLVDRNDIAKFRQYYGVEPSEEPFDLGRIQQDLLNHHFDAKLLTGWATLSKSQRTGELDKPFGAYENEFDTRNGIIVANSNDRRWDSQKQLPWSELMYQTWQTVSAIQGGGPISTLRTVVRKQVTNLGTQAVLNALYKLNQPEIKRGDPKWYRWSGAEQPLFFLALLGTDNVKGVLWLLNDHAREMGRKEISEIWTRWGEQDPDIWIELRPAEWPFRVTHCRRVAAAPAADGLFCPRAVCKTYPSSVSEA
ncbi:MAG: hypothetical protein LQ344_005716 [Seirophora lacunosa]|nr:MAG: hypothetical protein LQ344_005716 [Seirophora lacunosa]